MSEIREGGRYWIEVEAIRPTLNGDEWHARTVVGGKNIYPRQVDLKPTPATPAATPMAAPGLVTSGPIEIKFHDRESWLIHHFEEFIEYVAARHEHKSPDCGCQTCSEIGLAKWSITASEPAAAQPQRESEQPEQTLREAVQDMMPLIELYAEREINSPANHQEFARQTEQKLGRLRAALPPQTDSQEPR